MKTWLLSLKSIERDLAPSARAKPTSSPPWSACKSTWNVYKKQSSWKKRRQNWRIRHSTRERTGHHQSHNPMPPNLPRNAISIWQASPQVKKNTAMDRTGLVILLAVVALLDPSQRCVVKQHKVSPICHSVTTSNQCKPLACSRITPQPTSWSTTTKQMEWILFKTGTTWDSKVTCWE